MRTVELNRKTAETDISLKLNLDGTGIAHIDTGLGFFDHMLTSFAVHSRIDLSLTVVGDLQVDSHHTVEDTGLVLGSAIAKALGDKKGIERFADVHIPMDETLSFCAIDISGRPFLVFDAEFKNQFMGTFDTGHIEEFMRAFSMSGSITLHIKNIYGNDDHHKAESMFKALAHCIRKAKAITSDKILSSKGVL